MKVAITKETRAHEKRVAASPETVKKMVQMGLDVVIERRAGLAASFTDAAYEAAGAKIALWVTAGAFVGATEGHTAVRTSQRR